MLLSFIHNRQSLYVVDGPDLSTRLLQWWYGGYRQSSCAHSAITAPWVPLSLCSPAILILSASGLRTLCHYLFEPSARSPPHCSVLPTSHRHPGRAPKCDTHDSQQRGCVCVGGGCCTQEGLEARTVAGFKLYSVIVTVVVGYIYGLTSTWSSNRGTIMAHVCIGWGFSKKELCRLLKTYHTSNNPQIDL